MAGSKSLRLEDFRAIARVVNECRDLGADAPVWQAHFAREAARLAGADFCMVSDDRVVSDSHAAGDEVRIPDFAVWGWENGFDQAIWPALAAKFVRHGPGFSPMYDPFLDILEKSPAIALTNGDLLEGTRWERSEYHGDYHRPSGAGAMMYSHMNATAAQSTGSLLTLIRLAGAGDFSQRSRTITQALALSVGDLLGGPLASHADPAPSRLSPRCRAVLACLLQGDGDKQIGQRLGITRHTVNQYAKIVFRHFRVSSRGELLARWIQRGWGPLGLPEADQA